MPRHTTHTHKPLISSIHTPPHMHINTEHHTKLHTDRATGTVPHAKCPCTPLPQSPQSWSGHSQLPVLSPGLLDFSYPSSLQFLERSKHTPIFAFSAPSAQFLFAWLCTQLSFFQVSKGHTGHSLSGWSAPSHCSPGWPYLSVHRCECSWGIIRPRLILSFCRWQSRNLV